MEKKKKKENSKEVIVDNHNKEIKSKDGIDNNMTDIIPEEVLKTIPVEERGKMVSIIKQSMFSGIVKKNNPISEKITEEHISTLIRNSDEQDKRDRKEHIGDKYFSITLIVIALAFVGFLIVFLQSNEKLLITIITAIFSFIGGFGFGKSTKKHG